MGDNNSNTTLNILTCGAVEEVVVRRHGLGAAGGVPALGAAEVGHVVVGSRHTAAALVARLAHRVVDGLTDTVHLQFKNEKPGEEQMEK